MFAFMGVLWHTVTHITSPHEVNILEKLQKKEKRTQRKHFILRPSVFKTSKRLAKKYDISMSELVDNLLEQAVENDK